MSNRLYMSCRNKTTTISEFLNQIFEAHVFPFKPYTPKIKITEVLLCGKFKDVRLVSLIGMK